MTIKFSKVGRYTTPLFIALLAILTGCRHEPVIPNDPQGRPGEGNGTGGGGPTPDPCDPAIVYFQQDVLPMFISSCAFSGCHDPITMRDGVDLSSYAAIMGSNVIDLDDPANSDIIENMMETDLDDIMPPPPNEPMTSDQINTIFTWIQQGAQNNSCEEVVCDLSHITWSGTVAPLMQNKCTGCHSGSSPSGGHDLTSWSVANMLATSGTLGAAIQHQSGVASMPPAGGMLPQCDIDRILAWVNDGALNN